VELFARLAVGVVLLVSAAAKLRAWRELPALVGGYGIPAGLRRPAAWALIAVEAALGLALVTRAAPGIASLAAVALGLVFVGFVALARARGVRRLRCGCFGTDERGTGFLLARALGFTALAALAAWGDELPAPAATRETVAAAAFALLALAVLVLAALALYARRRQVVRRRGVSAP
jgi:hypothetical protein